MVRGAEVAVDVLHLQHLVVRHLGFGQQDVHVSGHPASDGVNRVADGHALGDQLLGHLLDGVLRPRNGQPVAGNYDHAFCIAQQERHVVW
jgi:hypothetical protein